jgi:hypothetical protein
LVADLGLAYVDRLCRGVGGGGGGFTQGELCSVLLGISLLVFIHTRYHEQVGLSSERTGRQRAPFAAAAGFSVNRDSLLLIRGFFIPF